MFLREYPYIAVFCLTAVISGCVALTAWTRRETAPATRPFTWLMVAIAAYATAAAANASTFTLQSTIFWANVEYITSNSVVALYLIFTLRFAGYKRWLRPKGRLLFWVLPALNVLLVLTNSWHQLVWSKWHLPTAPGQIITASHGAGYLWIVACFYIYVLTGSLLVARVALTAPKLYRNQALVVIASACPPVMAGSLYVLEVVPLSINILPISFLFTGLIYFVSLFRFRLFDLLPIARDVLVERMTEGVIVLDAESRVIDINPAAQQYISKSLPFMGRSIEAVMSQWPEIIDCCYSDLDVVTTTIVRVQIPCCLEVRATTLYDLRQQRSGKVLVVRDITEQHQRQLQLQQANASLQTQLKEIQTLRDQLKEQATRDRLTGLFNRRYFEEAMPAELFKAKRSGQSLAVMLLDIDHFKQVNDTYGHLAGDHALRLFAQTVQGHIRKSDIACRYGGEEFVIAFPDMSLSEACKRANKIREAFKAISIEFEEYRFNVTVSIGVGVFTGGDETQDQLLNQIDQALYAAKASGRDRVATVANPAPISDRQKQLENAIREYQRLAAMRPV